MSAATLKTLFHPFESGELPPPARDGRVLFLGAEPGFVLPEGFAQDLHAVQGFRPDFLALQRGGYRVEPGVPDGLFDMALVLAGRHRGENELRVANALERTVPNALILVAGAKEEGVASLRRHLAELLPIQGQMAKYHGLAFWFRRPADAAAIAGIMRAENRDTLIEGRFLTTPGMFSHERIDRGSRSLAQALPSDVSGAAADFCAGWGYLAAELLARCPGISSVDLYEADFASLEAARRNLDDAAVPVGFLWHDLLSEAVGKRYDVIVMNPPFHQGRAAEPAIGQRLIEAAAKALRARGRLFMVANKGLPYERVLASSFARHREVADDGAFKVFVAEK